MGDIKTAAQIAAEKLAKIGEPTEQERLKWKYGPEGEKLAASYLKEDINLGNEIKKFDEKARKLITGSVNEILMRNISLPHNEMARKTTKKSMDGIKALKNNKSAVENVFKKMQHILDHYVQEGAQQKKQAYEQLKQEFEAKIQEMIRKQTGTTTGRMKIDVEKQPQFQEEWQRLQAQMEGQYVQLLDEYKQELAVID
jgi:formate dehydrogenase maturation protein FdhE